MATFTVEEDASGLGLLIEANDLLDSAGGEDLFFDRFTDPEHGTIQFLGPGFLLAYEPEADFNGTDSFQVWFSEESNRGEEQFTTTLTFVVEPQDDAPTAISDGPIGLVPGTLRTLNAELIGNDFDVDGDSLEIVEVEAIDPLHFSELVISAGDVRVRLMDDFAGQTQITYTVADLSGLTASAEVTFDTRTPLPSRETVLAVNIGADTPYTATDGTVFAADDLGIGRPFSRPGLITDTEDDTLFETEVFGPEGLNYDFELADGIYEITLYFAEIWDRAFEPGTRIFDIAVEDEVVASDVDLAELAGARTAWQSSHTVSVDDGELDIDLLKGEQNPKLSALKVTRIDADDGDGPGDDEASLALVDTERGERLLDLGSSVVVEAKSVMGRPLGTSVVVDEDAPGGSAVVTMNGVSAGVDTVPATPSGPPDGLPNKAVAGGLTLDSGDTVNIAAEPISTPGGGDPHFAKVSAAVQVQQDILDAGRPAEADIFAIDPTRVGATTIRAFEDTVDHLALFGGLIDSADQVLDRATAVDGDTYINFGFGNVLTIEDFMALSPNDLIF